MRFDIILITSLDQFVIIFIIVAIFFLFFVDCLFMLFQSKCTINEFIQEWKIKKKTRFYFSIWIYLRA